MSVGPPVSGGPTFARRPRTDRLWLIASLLIAYCNVRTLYLRNVPDDVGARLERLAARAGMSISAFAVRELTERSRRADNLELLADLPDVGLDVDDLLADLDAGRVQR